LVSNTSEEERSDWVGEVDIGRFVDWSVTEILTQNMTESKIDNRSRKCF